MKLLGNNSYRKLGYGQADPFILESGGRFYIYTSGIDGIYAYESDTLTGPWSFIGNVFHHKDYKEYWAPSVIEIDGLYYLYCSFDFDGDIPDPANHTQTMHVATSTDPRGPFFNPKPLLHPFSIDSHVVKNESGLFIFYSTNDYEASYPGTRIVVDRLLAPDKALGHPVTVVQPSLDEDLFMKDRFKQGEDWYTIEGAFYFKEGDWQYVMYSGNCYEKPSYYVGYARAKTSETDLTKIRFKKYPNDQTYAPVLHANSYEEGTGHHSMIKHNGQWYAVYHARDIGADLLPGDQRTARICKLHICDGIITAERYEDKI